MPTTKPIAQPSPEHQQGEGLGPIIAYDVKKIEQDADYLIKVLKRVKEKAPELWGVFRVKA